MGLRVRGFPLAFRCTDCSFLIVTLRKYAGKTGRCPSCNEQQVIPDRVQFACPCCNDQVRVTGQWAGRRILCPRCHDTIRVPGLSEDWRENWRDDDPPLQSGAHQKLVKTASQIRSIEESEFEEFDSETEVYDPYAPDLQALSEDFRPGDELIEAALASTPTVAPASTPPADDSAVDEESRELFGLSGEEFRESREANGLFGLSGEELGPRELFAASDVRLTEQDPATDDAVADLLNRVAAEVQGPQIEYPAV